MDFNHNLAIKTKITESDLLIGDVIFFMNSLGQPHHVALYAGLRENIHFITHAVSNPYNSMMATRLKESEYPYRIFRCKDFNLAVQAACRMNSWVKSGLRFSHEKTDGIYSNFVDTYPMCHPKIGGNAQAVEGRKNFPLIIYRYIEMASHPKTPFMVNHEQNEGVRCSEALVMAFNIETLLQADAVKSTKQLGVNWISDKTTLEPELIQEKFSPPSEYWSYYEKRNNINEYAPYGVLPENNVKDGYCPCSLLAWNYDLYPYIQEFVKSYPFSLPMDSTIATSWALLTQMIETPNLWEDMGDLNVAIVNHSVDELEKNKNQWKKYVTDLFDKRKNEETLFFSQIKSLSETSEFKFSPTKVKGRARAVSESSGDSTNERDMLLEKKNQVLIHRAYKHTSPEKIIISAEEPVTTRQPSKTKRCLFHTPK